MNNAMLRTALIYGIISGGIVIATITIGIANAEPEDMTGNQAIGYLIMLVALSIIFLGIKQYRDRELGGVIKFWKAFGLGLAISVVAGIVYVIGWEIYLAVSDNSFLENYIAASLEAKRAAGASEAELAEFAREMEELSKNYENPLFRVPMTFTEIFPVGVIIALISAAILRNPKVLPARG